MVKTCRLRLSHIISNYRGRALLGLTVLLSIFSLALLAHSSIYTREAQAAANTNINFQARLLTSGGALVPDGNYSIAFKVYPAVSGGSAPWTETQVVSVKNGYASVSLGSVTPFSGSGIDWTQEQWLTMNVNGDGEMSPRMKITAVPLALRSNQAESLTNGAGSLTAADLAQLAPGSVQSVNSVNSALRLNQVGAGGLLQLQGNGSNVLTVSKAGDISTTAGITVGNSTLTTAGTIRWNGVDFEGYDGSQWKSLTVSAGGGGGGTVNQKTVIKTANETVTNNATLQDDDQLFFPIAANEKWAFRFVLQANAPATPDIKFAVTAPGGATCTVGVLDAEGAVAVGNLGCGVSSGLIVGNTTNDVYEVVGTVVNGATPGNVTLQWAQNTANGAGSVVYAGSYLLATSDTGTANQNFVQNGNSFGATAILGTTDTNSLSLVTDGVSRLVIDTNGDALFNSKATVTGDFIVNSNTFLNGDITLGDSSVDVITLNSNTFQLLNGLNLDNGTLMIDSANNRIGINNSSPANTLSINSAATADSSAEVLIYTNSSTQKGLVIQNSAGQTANSFEVQSDNGVALLAFNPSGALIIGSDISGSSVAGQIILNDANNANGFASILGTSSVTANRNINLPDEDGTICLSGSASCGFINFAKATAQADSSTNSSIFINKTGASGDIITLQDNGNSVFRVARNGSLEIRQDSTVALAIKNSAGTDFFGVDTSGAIVRIGSSTADGVGTLLVLDSKNTAGDPTGSNGGMYYNSSSNKFRCYEDGKWVDCIGTRQVRSFIDTTSDAAVDANTTSYWDTGAENNNSVPNIAPSTTTKAVTGSVSMEVSSATTADRSIVARVERSIGSPASCGSGTPVGTILSTFTTNNGEKASNTMIFLDTPNTTNTVYYTLCSDSATSSAASMTINRIRITLEEANNSN